MIIQLYMDKNHQIEWVYETQTESAKYFKFNKPLRRIK